MKRRVNLICVLLCVVLVLSTIGCGKNEEKPSADAPEAVTDISTENVSAGVDITESDNLEKDDSAEEEAKQKAEEEERQKAEEEAKQKAEEERQKAEEEAKQKAEEEERQKAEEEERQKAEEEAKQKAEEEERQKAEEEAKKKAEEEERQKAEEAKAKAEEEKKHQEQLNSFSMMYYLAITAEEIRTSKDNRLILDDIYTSLLNDINPGAIDDDTQAHLQNLRDIIKSYMDISTKRERLQYIYNQNKAAAIRSAVPNPLAILSVTKSMDWKKLALSVAYTAVDSLTSYKNASDSADREFLMSGWDLDDQERDTVMKNRERAFDYMVDMVQKYDLDGMMTLNEKSIEKFAQICAIESAPERIKRLVAEEDTYKLLGNYWLELADSYFEDEQYAKCLECVDKYDELYTGIYRQDTNYVKILPKAIASAENAYSGNKTKCVQVVKKYADAIVKNTSTDDWATRYFVAQVYMDLATKTNDNSYLEKSYKIASDNVTVLLEEQRKLNSTYLNDVVEVTVSEPDYKYLNEQEKKDKKKEYEEEKKRVKEYNKSLKEIRKTELPTIYEPLALNCELLFALSEKINVSDSEKKEMDKILKTASNGIFMTKPINDSYSYADVSSKYTVGFSESEITIPVNLLSSGAKISVSVQEKNGTPTIFNDCVIDEVKREGTTIDTFTAHVSSKSLKKYEWTGDSKITITITYGDAYDKIEEFHCSVVEFEEHWYGNKVVFG